MFYPLAKILWFLFKPSSLIVIILVAGVVLSATPGHRLGRRLLFGGLFTLVLVSLSPIGEWLFLPLENRFPRADLTDGVPIAGIILLGGVEDTRSTPRRELASLNDSAERFIEAVALARRFPEARVVFSGGSAGLQATEEPEASTAAAVLEALGLAKERITLEDGSRDTYENAVFTKRLIGPNPSGRWLLITSAWHMPRAVGCFRRAGLRVEAWPVDYRTTGRVDWLIEPGIGTGLQQIDFVVREYVGLVIYYLRGRTDALLPGS